MSGRLIAIGDVHGCSVALRTLVGAIAPAPDDRLVLLGDYIDRGPDSRGVLDFILDLEHRCQVLPILGNHEEMMWLVLTERARASDWLRYGGVQTLDSYGFVNDLSVIPREHLDFICRCHEYVETEHHLFLHANYDERVALAELDAETLRWRSLTAHLPGPHCSGKQAIVGHTSQPSGEILDHGHLKCIDTHCYAGQWLTALEVESGQVWQANNDGALRTPAP